MTPRPARATKRAAACETTRGSFALGILLALAVLFTGRAADAADEAAPTRPATAPLVLLVQGDAVLASTPGAPDDPPPGAELRLRRARVGDDVTLGHFRLRAVVEGQSKNADGQNFTPMEGGRLGGPMRVTDAFVSFAPYALLHATVGTMRVPFSLSRQVDAADLRLPERAPIIDAVAPDYRVGAALASDAGALAGAVAFMAADPNLDGHLFSRGAFVAARLAAEPIGPVGVTPWRRPATDPWNDWFRFSVGASILYGSLVEPRTTEAGGDFQAQWRSLAVTGEYIYAHAPSGTEQGAVLEPGVNLPRVRLLDFGNDRGLFGRHLGIVARGDWRRAAGVDQWGAGAALTSFLWDPNVRLQLGFERRTAASVISDWAIVRLAIAVE
jgi:hypothetical protein